MDGDYKMNGIQIAEQKVSYFLDPPSLSWYKSQFIFNVSVVFAGLINLAAQNS